MLINPAYIQNQVNTLSVDSILRIPGTIWDTEFTGLVVPSGWTMSFSGSASVDYALTHPSCATLTLPASGGWRLSRNDFTLSGAMSFTLKCGWAGQTNYSHIFTELGTSDEQNMYYTGIIYANKIRLESSTRDSGTFNYGRQSLDLAPDSRPGYHGWLYLHMQCNSSMQWFGAVSMDCKSWVKFTSTYTKSFTPSYLAIFGSNSDTHIQKISLDWFRVNWLFI